MLQKFVKVFGGDPNKREIEKTTDIVEQVNALEPEFEALSDEALRAQDGRVPPAPGRRSRRYPG